VVVMLSLKIKRFFLANLSYPCLASDALYLLSVAVLVAQPPYVLQCSLTCPLVSLLLCTL